MRPHDRKATAGAAAVSLAILLLVSCSGGEDIMLEEDIEGFYLGETFDGFIKRVGTSVNWTEVASPRHEKRGKIIAVTGTAAGSREIEMSRLTFFEDRLMEIVIYYKRDTFAQLEMRRNHLVEKYGVEPTSPDGTTEMAFKTYWFDVDRMSITLRRITKKPKTEMYAQYQHKELMNRYKKKAGR